MLEWLWYGNGESSNGRISGSAPEDRGSNPRSPTTDALLEAITKQLERLVESVLDLQRRVRYLEFESLNKKSNTW